MITALVLVLGQAAAATPTLAPVATPPAKLSGGFGQAATPKAPGKTRVVITDAALAPATAAKAGTFSVSGARGPATPPPAAATADGDAAAPRDEETAWRERVAGLRAALAQAQKDLDAASDANTVVAWGNLGHDYEMLMAMRNAALAPYRMRVQEIRSELAGLPEECRKTPGCQPGWVR